ncbi:MAG: CaiB/BaiF CoA transferase family protein [Microbacterium gubbeenense]
MSVPLSPTVKEDRSQMLDHAPADFRPLEGVRIIDFTRLLAGPYATMALAEMGADVIKVEMPGTGDETRSWGPPFISGSSAYFHAVNRGKRSIALNLSTSEGKKHADALIASADVVLENFRPGVADRLGIGAEKVLTQHPHIVYGSITGFGSHGPLAEHAGTEVIVEAESGLMSVTGFPGGEPVRFGVAMIDIASGLSVINGILAALVERGRTGRGRAITVSLYATAISCLGTIIAGASAGGGTPRAWGSAHPSIVPYRAFATSDGHVVLGATNDPMFVRLRHALDLDDALGSEHWRANEGRVRDRDELESTLADRVSELTVEEVLTRLREHRVLVAPVRTPDDAARSEQARALGLIVEDDGLLVARSPLSTNGTRVLDAAPALGEHTDKVLEELGALAQEAAR